MTSQCRLNVSIPSQSGSLLSVVRSQRWLLVTMVSIPSQSGSLLSGTSTPVTSPAPKRLNTLTVGQPLVGPAGMRGRTVCGSSQYPHSRAASCRIEDRGSQLSSHSLNTLTVGQPLVGSVTAGAQTAKSGLNTLTVGQPLVGCLPNTSTCSPGWSQYPHSRAASCRASLPGASKMQLLVSQYPHSRAASCRRSPSFRR